MSDLTPAVGSTLAIAKEGLDAIIAALQAAGYQTLGPQVRENALVYDTIDSSDDLPRGYCAVQEAGKYTLQACSSDRYFDLTPGAQSWKQFFFPPRSELLRLQKNGKGWKRIPTDDNPPPQALVGVRPCELAAILIQDKVFLRAEWSDPIYRQRRQRAFILAANCLKPGDTCFCASMGTGPEAQGGFDLNLTELDEFFLVEIGSEAGRRIMSTVPSQPASAFLLAAASRSLGEARQQMGRSLPKAEEVPELLLGNLEHPHWEVIAARCLGCANCTLVCPTCFCWDTQENTDLSGSQTNRERVWDSCFNPDYSYIAGGNTRPNIRARYRQWLTHKLATWQRQFGTSGCVGCGRCITWCPAGIDLTAEIATFRQEVTA